MSLVVIAAHFIYRYFAICRPLHNEYGIDVDDIDLVAIMYFTTTPDGLVPRWENLAVCIDMLFLIAIVLTIIIFFCIKIQTALRNNITIVPIVTGFGPASVFFFAPLVGWSLGKYTNIITVILSFYPLCDPIVVLMMIADYRRAIYRMITCQKITQRVSSTGNTSNQVDPSLSRS
ncbi:hypothetical protein WR25_02190 [Diploscapter pachys]|uniref:G-protein coupled receptors family 1 profile domain-containing protein n=1 Tax=Diploscapter pachys TaxID=2018661 RepID=A0A2A2J922_9BILA|nr:hypothetical protein WR25_02190 [Diploscapter pachys]